ncbi:EAL domain-containing protein [Vibrio mimicus]
MNPVYWSTSISNSVINNEFIPFFQGIYDSEQGRVTGYEVLTRWKRG